LMFCSPSLSSTRAKSDILDSRDGVGADMTARAWNALFK